MKQLMMLLFLCTIISCTVGPDYKQPQQTLPEAFDQAENLVGEAAVEAWWQEYGDPALDQLIDRVQQVNFDVRIAETRLREARAGLAVARGERLPEVNAAGSFQRAKASENGQEPGATFFRQGLASPYQNLYQAGFDTSWEFDLFGRMRRGVEAAEARFEVAVAAVAQTRLTLTAEVARLYFVHRGLRERQAIIERRIELRQRIAEFVAARRKAGIASELEESQAKALVAQAEAILPQLLAEQEAVAQGMSVLLDWEVAQVRQTLLGDPSHAQLPARIALSTPVTLLQRRPDLVLAERQLAAETADIGVAEGNLWPRISLAAMFGLEAQSGGDFFDSGSFQGLITPRISIPIFNRNRIRAGIDVAEAQRDAAELAFEKAVLQALSDVGTAIARYEGQRATQQKLSEAESEGNRALELAEVLYEKGLDDLLLVLDSERTLTEIQEGRVQAETQTYLASVTLYKALGGGW
jgi:NodT family efflux transporter outer membrane factor (OMF) lipoprotein